jgi:hypothetical protein
MKYIIYRVNNTTGTFSLPAGGTGLIEAKASGDVNVPSSWVPRLKLSYSAANNGTASSNSAIVENKFPFPVLGGKVRFIVPKGNTYTVANAAVSQEFDGDNVHVVDVTFDVTTNNSKTISIAIASTAINDLKSEKYFSIYPNPYKQGKLSINLSGFENQSNIVLKITNVMGQTIYQQNINSSNEELNVPINLKEAIYVVSIESDKHAAFTKLIVR